MFNKSEIAGLQPPDVAEVLDRWRESLHVEHAARMKAYDERPTVAARLELPKSDPHALGFVPTIGMVRVQKPGWEAALDDLLERLLAAGWLVAS